MNLDDHSLPELQAFVDNMPTLGLVVLAVLLQTVGRSVSAYTPTSVRVCTVFLITGFFAYEYQRHEPYALDEFLLIATRCICVAAIFVPFGNMTALAIHHLNSGLIRWRHEIAQANRKALERNKQRREQRREEQRQRELLENESGDIDEGALFERAMAAAHEEFQRECNVVSSFEDLDEFERAAAIDQARAKMTSRIHQIMQGEY